jgi:hypothetical protein
MHPSVPHCRIFSVTASQRTFQYGRHGAASHNTMGVASGNGQIAQASHPLPDLASVSHFMLLRLITNLLLLLYGSSEMAQISGRPNLLALLRLSYPRLWRSCKAATARVTSPVVQTCKSMLKCSVRAALGSHSICSQRAGIAVIPPIPTTYSDRIHYVCR